MRRIIECQVTDEYVRGDRMVVGAAGSHNDVALRLAFNPMWAGTARSIVWKDALGGNPIVTVLGTDLLVPGETEVYIVPIPAEPKAYAGDMSMTIKGAVVDGDKVTSATLTARAFFTVMESDWDEDAEDTQDITPTQAEQLQAQLEVIKDDIAKVAKVEETAGQYAADAAESAKAAGNSASSAENSASLASLSAQGAAGSATKANDSRLAAKTAEAGSKAAQAAAEQARDEAQAIAGGDFATKPALDRHTTDKNNPHDVTLAQVGGSNPNLLDNWYFADPIDQRGGWVVLPGKELYNKTTGAVEGYTETYMTVSGYADDSGGFKSTLTNGQVVLTQDCVRGYAGAGYTIDRWQQTGSNCTTAISNSGLLMSSGGTGYDYLSQKVPIDSSLTGTTVTFSAFCESDNIITLRIYANVVSGTALKSTTSYGVNGVISATVTVPDNATSLHVLFYPDTVTGSVSKVGDTCLLKAAKLELGSTQTLAHQENGNWVLNDPPPDKGMELLKCIQSTADSADAYANKVIYHTGNKPTAADVGAMEQLSANAELSLMGWYKIGYFPSTIYPAQAIVMVGNAFTDSEPHMVTAAVSFAGQYSPNIVVLASNQSGNKRNFTKLRIVKDATANGYALETYYAKDALNMAYVTIVGNVDDAREWTVHAFEPSVAKEAAKLDVTVDKVQSGNALTDASGVKKPGDTMNGTLSFKPSGVAGYGQLYKNATADFDYGMLFCDRSAAGGLMGLKLDATRSLARITNESAEYNILHTGNVTAGTTDITAGSTSLATGSFYDVYE